MTLEDIGENSDTALLYKTNLTDCCKNGTAIGNWYFPNGTRVLSHGNQWDFYRSRGDMVVWLHRKRGGVDGIYHCEISDSVSMNVNQSIYIGVYTASTGEWPCLYTLVLFNFPAVLMLPQGLHVSKVTKVEISMKSFIL